MTDELKSIIKNATDKIQALPEQELRNDMKLFVSSILDFVGSESPKILVKGNDEDKGRLFLKMIMNVGMDALNPFNAKKTKEKFAKFLFSHYSSRHYNRL